jgi:FkbM family methyltransferase
MIFRFKCWIYKIFGQAFYLQLLHRGFFLAYDLGLLKKNYIYKYHYFVKNLIKQGDTVVDIGANLGYYTGIFSRLVGNKGKVVAVEPIVPFFEVVRYFYGSKGNVMLNNVALGNNQEEKIMMEVPMQNGLPRTGLAHIKSNPSTLDNPSFSKIGDNLPFEVKMAMGSKLLGSLEKIDYIKCDIEGYESVVIPEIEEIFLKFRPILQIETSGEAKSTVDAVMEKARYVPYSLYQGKLVKALKTGTEFGDILFVPSEKELGWVQALRDQGF